MDNDAHEYVKQRKQRIKDENLLGFERRNRKRQKRKRGKKKEEQRKKKVNDVCRFTKEGKI